MPAGSTGDNNLERLASVLTDLGATLRGVDDDIPFQLDARALAAGDSFTFTTPKGALDCLSTPAGTAGFADLDADATSEELGATPIRVCSLQSLERMKRAAGRPKDLIALEWIRAIRDETEDWRLVPRVSVRGSTQVAERVHAAAGNIGPPPARTRGPARAQGARTTR